MADAEYNHEVVAATLLGALARSGRLKHPISPKLLRTIDNNPKLKAGFVHGITDATPLLDPDFASQKEQNTQQD